MDGIRAVFLDVGETIVDESREYGAWADWLGVPRHTFSAVLGAVSRAPSGRSALYLWVTNYRMHAPPPKGTHGPTGPPSRMRSALRIFFV
jgi:hypothetical protein